jgi:hypothetical protein
LLTQQFGSFFLLAPLTSLQAIDLYDILFNDKSKTYYGNLPLIPLSGGVPEGWGGRKKPLRHGFACHPLVEGNQHLIPLMRGVPEGRSEKKKPPRHGFACHPSIEGN